MREACRYRRRQWRSSDGSRRAYARDGISLREWLVSPGKTRSGLLQALGPTRAALLGPQTGPSHRLRSFSSQVICRPARSTFTPVDTVSRGRAPTRLRPLRSASRARTPFWLGDGSASAAGRLLRLVSRFCQSARASPRSTRRNPRKHSLGTDVFVYIGPMNAVTVPDQFPSCPLRRSCI